LTGRLAHALGTQYDNYITLNLEKENDASFFVNGNDEKKIWQQILLEHNVKSNSASTLLFIDEIQEVPRAIQLLRYFYEELITKTSHHSQKSIVLYGIIM